MNTIDPTLIRLLQQPLECCGNCIALDPFEDPTDAGGGCDKGVRPGCYVGFFDYCTQWEDSINVDGHTFDAPFPAWSDPIIARLARGESVGVIGTAYGRRHARAYLYRLVTDPDQRTRLHFIDIDTPDQLQGLRLHWTATVPTTQRQPLSAAMDQALAAVMI